MREIVAGEALLVDSRDTHDREVDQATFRRVLGTFASGVTVVTVAHNGVLHGSTVASFCSLSLDPPLILICLANGATTGTLIERSGMFGVNILGDDGAELSRHFAGRHPHKFATVAHHIGDTGVPLLADAIAVLQCEVVEQMPGGDHSIFIGRVISATTSDNRHPLVYFRSEYHRLA